MAKTEGRGRLGAVLGLLVLTGMAYLGLKFIPVRAAAYQFEDALRDQVLLANSRRAPSDAQIRTNLRHRAVELGLPVRESAVRIQRRSRSRIRIDVTYTVPIELVGGYVYRWRFRVRREGAIY